MAEYNPLSSYFPTDLIHGLLAEHCASETGIIAGECQIKPNDKVIFREKNEVYEFFSISKGVNLNDVLKHWKVAQIVDDMKTGYLGIIYCNECNKQLVLAHRSTNFALGFKTTNFFLGSGVEADIESVLLNQIVEHQAQGYSATSIAILLARKYSFRLSITGHSLGAWLAGLSVFYCNTDLEYPNVKAVLFDGPGCREMIEKMSQSFPRGDAGSFTIENLDIISYLSAPNIVNCMNTHVGTVYTVFPDIRNSLPSFLSKLLSQKTEDALLSLYGHHPKILLEQFDSQTGKPINYAKVIKWPSISYKDPLFTSINSALFLKLNNFFIGDRWFSGLVKVGVIGIVSRFARNYDMPTVGCIAFLLGNFGKTDHQQFWFAHDFLEKDKGYSPSDVDRFDNFKRIYKGNYHVINMKSSLEINQKLTKKYVDWNLIQLKKYSSKMFLFSITGKLYKEAKRLLPLYDVNETIVATQPYTVHDLRDKMRELLVQYDGELSNFFEKAEKFLGPELQNSTQIQSVNNFLNLAEDVVIIENLMTVIFNSGKNIVIVSGLPKVGKSCLLKQLARKMILEEEFTGRILFDTSTSPEIVYRELAGSFGISPTERNIIERIHETLKIQGQKLVFIFDNVEEFSLVRKYLTRLPCNIFALISTRQSNLEGIDGAKFRLNCPGVLEDNVRVILHNIMNALVTEHPSAWLILQTVAILDIDVEIIQKEKIEKILKFHEMEDMDEAIFKLQSLSFISIEENNIKVEKFLRDGIIQIMDSIVTIEENPTFKLFAVASFFEPKEIESPLLFHFLKIQNENRLMQEMNIISELSNSNVFCTKNTTRLLNLTEDLINIVNSKDNNLTSLQNLLFNLRQELQKIEFKEVETMFQKSLNDWETKKEEFLETNSELMELFVSKLFYFVSFWKTFSYYFVSNVDVSHFVIIGDSGVGKSTLINYLLGHQLIVEKEEEELEGEQATIQIQNSPLLFAPIGDGFTSETAEVIPYNCPAEGHTIHTLAFAEQIHETREIIFWDCPGFGDNRGVMRQIQDSIYNKALGEFMGTESETDKHKKRFHFFIAIKESLLSNITGGFRKHIENTIFKYLGIKEIDQLQSFKTNLSLLIMQSSISSKTAYLRKFQNFRNNVANNEYSGLYAEFLDLVLKGEILISIFPKFKTDKILPPRVTAKPNTHYNNIEYDLLGLLDPVHCAKLEFSHYVSNDSLLKILALANLLNAYVRNRIRLSCETLSRKLMTAYFSLTNENIPNIKSAVRKRLQILVKNSPTSDPNAFLQFLKTVAGDSIDTEIITRIVACLNFIKTFDEENIKIDLPSWVEPLQNLQKAFEYYTSPIKSLNIGQENLKFLSPIILTSELAKELESVGAARTYKSVQLYAHLLIVDVDLILPGVDLAINALNWIALSGRTINLKGSNGGLGQTGQDGGNFYCGPIIKFDGFEIKIDTSGGNGGHGGFQFPALKKRIHICDATISQYTTQIGLTALKIDEISNSEEFSRNEAQLLEIRKLIERRKEIGRDILDLGNKIKAAETLSQNLQNLLEELANKVNVQKEIDQVRLKLKEFKSEGEIDQPKFKRLEDIKSLLDDVLRIEIISNKDAHIASIQKLAGDQDFLNAERQKLVVEDNQLLVEIKQRERHLDKNICRKFCVLLENEKLQDSLEQDLIQAKKELVQLKEELKNSNENLNTFIQKHSNYSAALEIFIKCERMLLETSKEIDDISSAQCEERSRKLVEAYNKEVDAKENFDVALRNFSLKADLKMVDEENSRILTIDRNGLQNLYKDLNDAQQVLNKEAEQFSANYKTTKDERNKTQKVLQVILVLEIEEKVNKITGLEEFENICERKLSVEKELQKLWENQSWVNWFKSIFTSEEYKNSMATISKRRLELYSALQNMESQKNTYDERVKAFEGFQDYVKYLNEYEIAKQNTEIEIGQFKQISEFENLKNIFESFLDAKKNFELAEIEEASAAKILLLNINSNGLNQETNLSGREKCDFTRIKDGLVKYILSEYMLYNTRFVEHYKFVATNGGQGGDGGKLKFNKRVENGQANFDEKLQSIALAGRGGENAFVLSGSYSCEHTFAWFRGRNQVLADEKFLSGVQGSVSTALALQSGMVVTKNVAEKTVDALLNRAVSEIASKRLASFSENWAIKAGLESLVVDRVEDTVISTVMTRLGPASFSGVGTELTKSTMPKLVSAVSVGLTAVITFGLQSILSAILAKTRSRWIRGPYLREAGFAADGREREWTFLNESEIREKFEKFISEVRTEMGTYKGILDLN